MVKNTKKRIILSIDKDKLKIIKKRAIDAEMTVSDFVSTKLSGIEEPKTISEVIESSETFKK